MWVDIGPSTKCGVELRLSVVSAWRWSYVSLLSVRGGGAEVSLRMSFKVYEECVRELCEECVRELCEE